MYTPMITRLLVSVVCGFLLGTSGLLVVPDLGRLAGPVLCDGELAPDIGEGRLAFTCTGADGQVRAVRPEAVVGWAIPICIGLALGPVSLLVSRLERKGRDIRRQIRDDLNRAVVARAEVLQATPIGPPKRQILMRAAMLRITFWMQVPGQRPYEARAIWWVEQDALRRMARGSALEVRVNPLQLARVYPAEPWAEYVWTEGS